MNQTDLGWAVARFSAGMMIAYHGAGKVFPVLGGGGFSATMTQLSDSFPAWLAFLAIVAEFFGGIGLAFGFLTRIAAFGVFCTMMVAAFQFNLPAIGGMAAVFQGSQDINKLYYPLLIGLVALGAVISGPGRFSIDFMLGLDDKLFRRKAIRATDPGETPPAL